VNAVEDRSPRAGPALTSRAKVMEWVTWLRSGLFFGQSLPVMMIRQAVSALFSTQMPSMPRPVPLVGAFPVC
jgi:hypothetical protein